MMSIRASFFNTHKRTLLALIFGLAFSATLAYAVPPTSPYLPSDQQLDPGCAPTDPNCTVDISSTINYVGTSYVGKTSGLGADGTNGGTAHNIFIGDSAGIDGASVSNAIALGAYAGTGGFSNTIILGNGTSGSPIANTKANQFMLAPSITEARLRDIDYTLPAAQAGGAGYVLVNNGSGTLSWGAQAGAGGAIALLTDGIANGSQTALNLVSGTGVSLIDNGSGSVTINGSAAPDTLYSADGTISSTRVVSYGNDLSFVDIASAKTGLAFNTTATTSILGDISLGSTYLSVDNNANSVIIGNGTLSIPTGASNGYVLTSDGSGNASWQAATGGGVWGAITGTLSDQTDLQNALDAKFDIPTGTTLQYIRGDGSLATFITTGLVLETNGVSNGDQTTLNLVAGTDISLSDDGIGGITIGSTFVPSITIQNTTSLFSTGLTGTGSGSTAANAIFLGVNAGNAVNNTDFSIFLGQSAGAGATDANNSIFLGQDAGNGATNARTSNFFGTSAGSGATDATSSNFFGPGAGINATTAGVANFFGQAAGANATNAASSNFFGLNAGNSATEATLSNFFGQGAGNGATNARESTFLGAGAGEFATNSSKSFFAGSEAGRYYVNFGFPTVGTLNAANSIFIGTQAGYSIADNTLDNSAIYDDTLSFANTSILIGHRTSTGGFSNSIAIGAYATNTATNQFMIGSTNRRIETLVFNGGTGNTCSIVSGTGITCSSDERLKTNITNLDTDTLDKVLSLKTVTYNWISDPEGRQMVGFIAQDLQPQFPQLVSQNIDGMLSVNYAQMTPILVEAIREMNLKIVDINDLTKDNSWRSALVAWLGNATNGIQSIFSKEVHTDTLCVKKSDGTELCLTGDQLQSAINGQGSTIIMPPPTPTPDPTPVTDPDPTPDPSPETPDPEATPEPTPEPAPEQGSTPDPAPEISTPAQ